MKAASMFNSLPSIFQSGLVIAGIEAPRGWTIEHGPGPAEFGVLGTPSIILFQGRKGKSKKLKKKTFDITDKGADYMYTLCTVGSHNCLESVQNTIVNPGNFYDKNLFKTLLVTRKFNF